MVRAKVYAGLTLSDAEVRAIGAEFSPPIRRGDLARDILAGVHVIGIVDGVFDHTAAVSPSEIMDALRAGLRVFGAASMGALRAADLAELGVVGVGRIFELARSRADFRDDWVAQAVVESERSLRPSSQAWVDLHFRLESAVAAGEVSEADRLTIERIYAELDYPERRLPGLVRALQERGLWTESMERAVELGASAAGPSQKRVDALALLDAVRSATATPGVSVAGRPPGARRVDRARYLSDFHFRRPGASSRLFSRARTASGLTSYELAAEEVVTGGVVVDVGAGDGALLRAVLRRHRRHVRALVAVEPSAAERSLAVSNLRGVAQGVDGTAEAIPLADAVADATLCHFALPYFDGGLRALGEMVRITRPGGQVVLAVPTGPSCEFLHELGQRVRAELAATGTRLELGSGVTVDGVVEALSQLGAPVVRTTTHHPTLRGGSEMIAELVPDLYGIDLLSGASRARLVTELYERFRSGPVELVFSFALLTAVREGTPEAESGLR